MSTIEVDKIIPQSGTDTQLGESGDTITIPAGATITNNGTATGFDTDTNDKVKVSANDTTPGFLNGKLVAGTNISLTEGSDGGNETLTAALSGTITPSDNTVTLAKMAPGTDGNIISYDASGLPVAIATGNDGQVLTSAGAGAQPAFETLPVGGITEVDMWRLSTYYTGYQDPINANWERADTSGFSYKGTGLTQSSGVFSFPSTGFWKIDFNWSGNSQTDTRNIGAGISATENNSSYINLGYNSTFLQRTNSDATYLSININVIFKVDNITTHKIRFWGGAANINAAPDTNAQVVGFTCFRLTDI